MANAVPNIGGLAARPGFGTLLEPKRLNCRSVGAGDRAPHGHEAQAENPAFLPDQADCVWRVRLRALLWLSLAPRVLGSPNL